MGTILSAEEKLERRRKKNRDSYHRNKHKPELRAQKTEYMRKWRAANPEKNRSTRIAYRSQRRNRDAEYMRRWRAENPERDKRSRDAYRSRNRDRTIANDKKSKLLRFIAIRGSKPAASFIGPPTLEVMLRRKKALDYWRKRTDSDIGFRIMNSIRRSLHYFVHAKGMSTFDLIGCTPNELRAHLESQFLPGMTWKNYGRNGWHIDHKIPASKFDLTDPEQQKWCFHYSNLRPEWAYVNRSKNAKILPEFEADFLRLTERFPSMKVASQFTLTN